MMRILMVILICVYSSAGTAKTIIEAPAAPIRVQMDSVPIAALVAMLMRDILKVPFSISPDVLGDTRPVSVNLSLPRDQLAVGVVSYLRGLGLNVQLIGGTVFVTKGSGAGAVQPSIRGIPFQSPLEPPQAQLGDPATQYSPPTFSMSGGPPDAITGTSSWVDGDILVIKPGFRSVGELADLIEPMFPAVKIAYREASEPKGQEIVGSVDTDVLAVNGSEDDLGRVRSFVEVLDVPRPVVSVRAVILQVSSTLTKGSALTAVANFFSGKLEVGFNSSNANSSDNYVRISTGNLSAAVSMLRSDGRFRVLAEPSLLALSGSTAMINSGAQVPTIGSVSFDGDGRPVRSVVYRDSGVSLTVTPRVRAGEIEIAVQQERSSFARTETGVNDSPTLNRSTSSARFSMTPGSTVALASLDEHSDTSGRSGLFERFMPLRSSSLSASQLVILLTADLAPVERPGGPLFYELKRNSDRPRADRSGATDAPAAPVS